MTHAQRTAARAARKAARRIRVLKEARVMVRKIDDLHIVDPRIVAMRDEIVKLAHEIGELRRRPANRIVLQ